MAAVEAPIAVLDRVASLLDVLNGRPPLTLAQIARLAQLPRSSAHRILQRLVELQWVQRRGFRYTLGVRMAELGSQVGRNDGVREAAAPVMHHLHRATGLTARLSTLMLPEVVHLDRAGGRAEGGRSWEVGARQPAVHTAAGRALLAELDPADWPALEIPTPSTRFGIRSGAQLVRELHAVRARDGVAVDVQGSCPGSTAVAVPVGPPGLPTRTALSLSGPADAVRVDRAVSLLRAAAADVWCAASGVARLRPRPRPAAVRSPMVATAQA